MSDDLPKAHAIVHTHLSGADLLLGLAMDRCEDREGWDYRRGIMAEMREEARRMAKAIEGMLDLLAEEERR